MNGLRVMIIDAQPEFRSLLMHHLTTHWPDIVVTEYDPVESGHLPDEFSGAGNDIVLLGGQLGDREGIDTLKRFMKVNNFPPVVYFGDETEEKDISKAGAAAFFTRDTIRHDALIVRVSDILADPTNAVISETIIAMGRHLGLETVAEGVENEAQLEFLTNRECDAFQGYYFSKPIPRDEFEKLVLQNRKRNT